MAMRFPNAVIWRAAGFVAALLLITSAITRAGDKIALVVGNDTYDKTGLFPALDNCASDAMLIGDTLAGMGFEVIRAQNASRSKSMNIPVANGFHREPMYCITLLPAYSRSSKNPP